MIESLTAESISLARSISFSSPIATVQGSWIIIRAVGLMSTRVPAIAMTLAALAARPSICT